MRSILRISVVGPPIMSTRDIDWLTAVNIEHTMFSKTFDEHKSRFDSIYLIEIIIHGSHGVYQPGFGA